MIVHIERLVLDGLVLDARGAEALRASLERALAGMSGDSGTANRYPAATDSAPPDGGRRPDPLGVASLGHAAARAVHRQISR